MLDEDQISDLVSILQSLESRDFKEGITPDRKVSVMLNCGEMEILLLVYLAQQQASLGGAGSQVMIQHKVFQYAASVRELALSHQRLSLSQHAVRLGISCLQSPSRQKPAVILTHGQRQHGHSTQKQMQI